jgi:hypothetical protein
LLVVGFAHGCSLGPGESTFDAFLYGVVCVMLFTVMLGLFVGLATAMFDGASPAWVVVAVVLTWPLPLYALVGPQRDFVTRAFAVLVACGFYGVGIAWHLGRWSGARQRGRRVRYMHRKLQEKGIYAGNENVEEAFEREFSRRREEGDPAHR